MSELPLPPSRSDPAHGEPVRLAATLQDDLEDTRLLLALGARLVSEDSIHAMHEEILTAAIALTRANAGVVQIRDRTSGELLLLASRGFAPELTARFRRVTADSPTSCGLALTTRERTFVDFEDPAGDNAREAMRLLFDAGCRSAQSTPLIARSGELMGMLTTHWHHPHRPGERELRFVDLLARQAADLIEQRQVTAALRVNEAKLEVELNDAKELQRISGRLIGKDPAGALHHEILEVAISLMRADMGSLQVMPSQAEDFHLLAWKGFHPDAAAFWQQVERDAGSVCGAALTVGERIIVTDVEDCDGWIGEDHLHHLRLCGIRAVQSTPLISRSGRLLGLISTHWGQKHHPSDRELRLLDVLARQAADFLEHGEVLETLRQTAEADAFRVALSDGLRPLTCPLEVQATALRILGEHLRADRTHYIEVEADGEHGHVHREHCRGTTASIVGRHRLDDFGPGLIRELREGTKLVVADSQTEPLLDAAEKAAWADVGIRACICVPLVKDGSLVAMFVASFAESRQVTTAEVSLVEETAERTWAAVGRAQAELALRHSEERLRTAMESAGMGAWDWDVAGDRVKWNDRRFLLLGLTPDGREQDGGFFLDFIHPEDRRRVSAELLQAVDEAGSFRAEFRIVRADNGEIRWMSGFGGTVAASQGRATRMTGAMYDSTGRRAHAESLEHARALLEQRVAARTRELGDALDQLRVESHERERIEQDRHDLLVRLVHAQEEERGRISRDLHDNLGQHMVAVLLHLETFQKHLVATGNSAGPTEYGFEEFRRVVDSLIKAVHRQAWELRPVELDELGLPVAIEHFVADWSARTGIAATFEVVDGEWRDNDSESAIALYRVVQEAPVNVARHANASSVRVVLASGPEAGVTIQDDGCGFDAGSATRRLGILGMKERMAIAGGVVEIDSAPGRGTLVCAQL